MLKKDCLAEVLQNVSGKKIPADVLAKCKTTCEVLDAFNALFKCVVTFSGIIGSTNVTSRMNVTVKDAKGNIIAANSDGKYTLKNGIYTYDATATGAVAKSNVAFTITNADETNGTKTVVVSFTAA
ncbi:MAG: hypothetical protein ACI4MS_00415 [Candidatus Coproplasma sp.]